MVLIAFFMVNIFNCGFCICDHEEFERFNRNRKAIVKQMLRFITRKNAETKCFVSLSLSKIYTCDKWFDKLHNILVYCA
jgi:hypothetical protein